MNIQKLLSHLRRAVDDFNMIQENDKIAVGLSGGKDSLALLTLLSNLKRFYPAKFSVVAVTVDMGFKNANFSGIADFCEKNGMPLEIEKTQIAEIIFDARKESNPCSLCSKMRRGALSSAANRLGCNKIALGHHSDDFLETFFLSLFFEGRLSVFSPVSYMSRSDVTLIRPMIYMRECDIAAFTKDFPVLKNPCPADKHTKREFAKNLIKEITKEIPFAKERALSALFHPERYNLLSESDFFKGKS